MGKSGKTLTKKNYFKTLYFANFRRSCLVPTCENSTVAFRLSPVPSSLVTVPSPKRSCSILVPTESSEPDEADELERGTDSTLLTGLRLDAGRDILGTVNERRSAKESSKRVERRFHGSSTSSLEYFLLPYVSADDERLDTKEIYSGAISSKKRLLLANSTLPYRKRLLAYLSTLAIYFVRSMCNLCSVLIFSIHTLMTMLFLLRKTARSVLLWTDYAMNSRPNKICQISSYIIRLSQHRPF